MKSNLFFLVIFLLVLKGFSQPYNQKIKLLGRSFNTAKSNYCQDPFSNNFNKIINVHTTNPLTIGSVYKMDVDSDGGRYYRIVSSDSGEDPTAVDDIYINNIISGPVIFSCNNFKYHRILYLGETLEEATTNFCIVNNSSGSKVNILINNPLTIGNVYQITTPDTSGPRYYKILYSQSSSSQDASENIDGSNVGSLTNINCPPEEADLEVVSVAINNDNTINVGDEKIVSWVMKNKSLINPTSTYSMKYYLSKNKIWDSNDIFISGPFGGGTGLNPNETKSGTQNIAIPGFQGVAGNTFYVILKVEPDVQDFDSTNNFSSSELSFFVNNSSGNPPSGNPDLIIDNANSTVKSSGAPGTVQSISTNVSHSLYLGENLQLKIDVKNIGNANSDTMKVGIYVTQGSQFSNAVLLSAVNFSGIIQPNNTSTRTTEISGSLIDGYTTSTGNAYIHIFVDKDDDEDEGSSGGENNNIFSSIPVKVYHTNR